MEIAGNLSSHTAKMPFDPMIPLLNKNQPLGQKNSAYNCICGVITQHGEEAEANSSGDKARKAKYASVYYGTWAQAGWL